MDACRQQLHVGTRQHIVKRYLCSLQYCLPAAQITQPLVYSKPSPNRASPRNRHRGRWKLVPEVNKVIPESPSGCCRLHGPCSPAQAGRQTPPCHETQRDRISLDPFTSQEQLEGQLMSA